MITIKLQYPESRILPAQDGSEIHLGVGAHTYYFEMTKYHGKYERSDSDKICVSFKFLDKDGKGFVHSNVLSCWYFVPKSGQVVRKVVFPGGEHYQMHLDSREEVKVITDTGDSIPLHFKRVQGRFKVQLKELGLDVCSSFYVREHGSEMAFSYLVPYEQLIWRTRLTLAWNV